MKKPVILLCATLMLGSPLECFAQPGPGPDNGPDRQDDRGPQQQQYRQPHQHPRPDQYNAHAYHNPDYRSHPGMPVPHREWRHGVVVEPIYRGDRYWVTDWHARHLYAPPRDHCWLNVNGDYILVDIASGVIVNVLGGH